MKYIILSVTLFFPMNMLFTQPSTPPQATATPEVAPTTPTPEAATAETAATSETAAAPTTAPAMPETAPAAPAAAPAQEAAPVAAPGPDVIPSQLTWPDTADLAENTPGLIQSNNPKIIELFKKAGQLFDNMATFIDLLIKTRADLYQKYFELDAKLDEFFQNTNLDEGSLEGLTLVDEDTTTTQLSTNMVTFKQEFDQINTQLEVIKTTKNSLKKTLSTLDSEIEKSKTLALQSRKKGLDILKQESESGAQAVYDGINKDLETLTSMQQKISTEATRDFQGAYDKIQVDIQTVQTLVGQLQAKAIVPPEPSLSQATPQPIAPPTQEATSNKLPPTQQQSTFPHYLLTRMTELFIGAMDVARTTYTTLKDALHKSATTTTLEPTIQPPKQESVPLIQPPQTPPIAQPQPIQPQPMTTPNSATQSPQAPPASQPESPQMPSAPQPMMPTDTVGQSSLQEHVNTTQLVAR